MGDAARERAVELFRQHGGMLRASEAFELGIHPRTLYGLRDSGVLDRLSRGVYRLASLPELAHPDLVTVALRVPRAIVCLVSALSFHDATNEIPREVQIALPRGTKTPSLDHPPIRVFRFSGAALTEGIETVSIDGVDVHVYGLAKTVADCFRFRNKLGTEVAVEALSQAIRHKRVRPGDILRYAEKMRVDGVMLPYLEALQ